LSQSKETYVEGKLKKWCASKTLAEKINTKIRHNMEAYNNSFLTQSDSNTQTNEYERVGYKETADTELLSIGFKINTLKPVEVQNPYVKENLKYEDNTEKEKNIQINEYVQASMSSTVDTQSKAIKSKKSTMNKELIDMWKLNESPDFDDYNKPLTKLVILRHFVKKNILD